MNAPHDTAALGAQAGTVWSVDEWSPLEEVIVGCVDEAILPAWDVVNAVTVPEGEWDAIARDLTAGRGKGHPYPPELVEAGRRAAANLVRLLESEGVKVRRPEPPAASQSFSTPEWAVESGFCAANPRDVMLVVGDEIIEAPMADRTRYFEIWPYRPLLKAYFQAGARWTAAPKPQLSDALYDASYRRPAPGEPMRYIVSEFEPVFDAAEFARCGRDLFTQLSHTTNRAGIAWLQRHLGEAFRIHVLPGINPEAIHLDSTFVPLAEGRALVNPEYLDLSRLPPVLKSWELLVAPPGSATPVPHKGLLSDWIHLNVLSLDGERIIVEASQTPLIDALRRWGFKPIPCAFEGYYPFIGSLHCATLDIRRRGALQSYF